MSNYSMLAVFRQEVETQVSILKEILSAMKTKMQSSHQLESLISATQVMKGVALIVDLESIAQFVEVMKECFSTALNQNFTFGEEQIDLLLSGGEILLNLSQVSDDELDGWLLENTLEITSTQHAIASLTFSPIVRPIMATPETNLEVNPPTPEPPPVATENDLSVSENPPPETDIFNLGGVSMLDLFRQEVDAQVTILNNGLLALESNPQSAQELESLMRAAHSVKGAARIVALDAAVQLAHVMEDCFVAAQNHKVVLGADQIDVLLQGVDLLLQISQVDEQDVPNWLAENHSEVETNRNAIAAILNPGSVSTAITISPTKSAIESITPSPPLTVSAESGKSEKTMETIAPQPREISASPVKELTPSPPAKTEISNASIEIKNPTQDRAIRVSAENLNRIMGLAGESLIEANWLQPFADSLVFLKARQVELSEILERLQETVTTGSIDLRQTVTYLDAARQKEQQCLAIMGDRLQELELFSRRTANLSDRLYREVITTHMRPFIDGVQGFPRMIRDLSRKLNKQVKLEIVGKSTSVDRDILKKLEAPLTHILRNAVDHGLEMPSERIEAGKPPEGKIHLEAFHRGGMLSITIRDDGGGIDSEKLRAKIIDKGLSTPEVAAQLTENELMEFLFLPGFSTAKQVTEISGRGVGLDIAKSMAQEVGGTVRATSQRGKGTSFHFQLPLTLSVVRTLLVEIAGEPYAFPLARIDQIIILNKADISVIEGRQYFTMEHKNIGLIAASQVLELSKPSPKLEALPIIIISDQSNTYGIVVDQFLGERDLVVRPLDPRLGKVQDITATALMGDGSPILIIDVSDLVRSIDNILNSRRLKKVDQGTETPNKHKSILVVDDSITVREMERKLLENQGYQVDVAVDGMEGWNAVRTNHYDLVLSDIDMPRMNGIELLKHIRNHPKLNTIPVIVVSYRDREEDRIQGLESGADYYLTKSSFHDDSLLNAVVDLIGKPL
jgi:two-component system, chemotaxis family, sensor histidine kinase and response regulator WspE